MDDTDHIPVTTTEDNNPIAQEDAEEQRRSAEVFDERRQRLTVLLAWSGLSLFVVGGFFVGRAVIASRPGGPSLVLPFIFVIGIICMGAVLLLVRNQRTDLAANLLVYSYTVVVALSVLFGANGTPESTWPTITFFYLITLWAGLLLRPFNTFVVATIACSLYYITAAYLQVPAGDSGGGFLQFPSYFLTRIGEIDTRLLAIYYGIAFAGLFFSTTVQRLIARLTERAVRLSHANKLIEQQVVERGQTAASVLSLAQQVAAASAQQLDSISEQHSAVQTITTAMEELDQVSAQIEGMANNVASFNLNAQEQVASGGATIKDALDAFNQLDGSVQQIASYIADLERKARDIQQVADEMGNIANEIRLLSLNATIEAAGAGELGNRFAVVASEVSRLANEARGAAESSRNIVDELLKATVIAVEASNQGRSVAERGASLAQQATSANQRISAMVEQAVTQVQGISVSTSQQHKAASQAVLMLRALNNSAAQSETTSRATTRAAEQLRRIATGLQLDGENLTLFVQPTDNVVNLWAAGSDTGNHLLIGG